MLEPCCHSVEPNQMCANALPVHLLRDVMNVRYAWHMSTRICPCLGKDDMCIISVKLNIAFHAMLRLSMSVLFSCCNLRLRQSTPAPACVFAGATVLSSAAAAVPVLLLALTASLSGLGGLLLSPAPSPAVLVPPHAACSAFSSGGRA